MNDTLRKLESELDKALDAFAEDTDTRASELLETTDQNAHAAYVEMCGAVSALYRDFKNALIDYLEKS